MSSAVVANFDAMQALRILLKLEEAPDQDSSYLRHLVLADAKRNVFAAAAEPASEEACAEVEAAAEEMVADAEDAPEETAVDVEAEESAPEETEAEGETSDSAAEEEAEAKAPPKKTSAKA